jgi:hypothetical protein
MKTTPGITEDKPVEDWDEMFDALATCARLKKEGDPHENPATPPSTESGKKMGEWAEDEGLD